LAQASWLKKSLWLQLRGVLGCWAGPLMPKSAHTVASIEYSQLQVPKHGLLAGTRVSVPLLSEDTFIVCYPQEDSFSLECPVRVPIASIDPVAGSVRTVVPHGLQNHWAYHPHVMLADLKGDGAEEVNGSCFIVLETSESVLRLGRYDPKSRKPVPVSLPGLAASLQEGTVVGDPTPAKLPEWSHGRSGIVTLAPRPAPGKMKCLQELRAALEAAYKGRAPLEPVVAVVPEAQCTGDLVVSECGSKCDGIFEQHGPTLYCNGVLRVAFIEGLGVVGGHGGLGVWCVLADLYPTYPLSEQRGYYHLQKHWEGPQLLYVCRDATPLSTRWEPVLGSYPGPAVRLSSAKPPLLCVVPHCVSRCGPFSGTPEVTTLVLDTAFNVEAAKWRGDARDLPRGHTCLEIALLLASIYKDLRSASVVCKTWHAALIHVHFPSAVRSVLQVAEAHTSVAVARPEEFLQLCLRQCRCPISRGLAITHDPVFKRYAWGVSIDELRLSAPSSAWRPSAGNDWTGEPVGEMLRELAPAFYVFARKLLPDARLPWDKNLHRDGMFKHGDGTKTIWTSLLDDLRCSGFDGKAHLLARSSEPEGFGKFFTFTGELLTSDERLGPALRVLADRLVATSSRWRVSLKGQAHGWSLSYHDKRGDEQCQMCKRFVRPTFCRICREKRGWSTLKAQETLKFNVVGESPVPYVELCISGMCVPFFCTTDDADRDAELLRVVLGDDAAHPGAGRSGDEDDEDLATPEDDDEDTSGPTVDGEEETEDGEEDGEEEAEAEAGLTRI